MSKNKLLKHHRSIDIFFRRVISLLSEKMPIWIGIIFTLAAFLFWQGLKLNEQKQIHRKTELEASTIKFELNNKIQERIAKRWEIRGKSSQKEWESITEVQVWPSKNLLITEKSFLPEVSLIAGILTVFLLAITVYLAQKTQIRKKQLELINQKLEQQISERKKFIEEISQSHQQYQSLVNWIEGIVWEVDAETFQFTFVSQKAEKLLGYPIEAWIEEPDFWKNHIHPDDREWAVKFCLVNSQQKEDYEFEYRMIAVDGRVLWLRDLVNVVIEDNKLVKLRGVMIDITAHKQAQIAVQESEERWQLALRGNNDGIWDWNLKTNEVFFSSRWKEMLGYAEEEISNHVNEWEKRVHPDDLNEVTNLIKAHFAKATPFYISEHRVLCKDGTYKWILDRGQALWDEQGNPIRMTGSHTDITERKNSEKAFIESQHFIQRIADATPSILYIYDLLENRNVYVNNEITVILGYTPKEIQKNQESLFNKLWHPNDLAVLSERIKRFEQAKDGEVIETEYRLKHRLGEWRWFYSRDTIFSRTPEGKPWQILGTATDITNRKQMEEELCQANQELNGLVNQLEQRNQEIIRLGELSDVLQACLTVEEAYKVIAQMLQPLFSNMSGGIFITSASRKLVEAVAVWEEESENLPTGEVRKINYSVNYKQISLSDSFPSQQLFSPHECWSLRRGRFHFIRGKNSGLVCKHIHTRPVESLCVPMMAQGEALGILYLSAKQPGQITEAKQILAVTVAEHIALALANLRLRETLQHQSIRDPLTGLYNRRYLEESLERELHRAAKVKQSLAVMMLDVDHFKNFNDTFGHDAGDAVLRELGIFLQKNTGASDIACRYGGEELTLIMPEICLVDVKERAENLRQGVKYLNLQHQGQHLGAITLSIGVAVYPEHGITGEELIQAADTALYAAKNGGRDRVSICC